MNPVDHPHGGGEGKDLRWSPPGEPVGASPRAAPASRTSPATSSSSAAGAPAGEALGGASDATQPEKGPFVDDHLPRRSTSRTRRTPSRSSRPGPVGRPSSRTSSVTPSPSTTVASMSRCSSPRRWSGTSWASSPRRGRSRVTSRTTGRASAASRGTATTETEYPSATAVARFVRISASKARRVIDLVRGKSVEEASTSCAGAPAGQRAGRQVIASAAANAQNNNGLDPATLVVATVYADEGPDRQAHPAARPGRAYRIRKRTSHITVIVESRPSAGRKGSKHPLRPAAAATSAARPGQEGRCQRRPRRRRARSSGPENQPHGFRLGITTDWKSRWYADKQYADYVKEDVAIRMAAGHRPGACRHRRRRDRADP